MRGLHDAFSDGANELSRDAPTDNFVRHDQAAAALRDVLDGKVGPMRDIALLNAAAALVIAGKAQRLEEGLNLAAAAINSGKASQTLQRLIAVTNSAVISH